MGPKCCMNYSSGEYEWIDENRYSWDQCEYVYNWDRSAFDDDSDNYYKYVSEIIDVSK